MSIETVLFDYGGVYSESPFEAAADVAREKGVSGERYLEIIFGPYDRDTDHAWHRLERGEISLEVAREEIIALGQSDGIDADPLHFFASMAKKGSGIRQPMVDYTIELKRAGLRTALITNNAHEFREHWRRSVPLDDMFDEVVDSSEVSMRKPDPRIFELTLERLGGARPDTALFLDDFDGNITAAEKLGIRGVLVTGDYDEAIAECRKLIGPR